MKKRKWLIMLVLAFLLVLLPERVGASSIEDSSIYNNPHVIPSPDGKAWTTDAGEQDYKVYPSGTPVITGEVGTREALLEGQHEYPMKKEGLLIVEKWLSANSPGHCSHAMKIEDMMYHGLPCNEFSCLAHYKTGWLAVCADCHEEVPFLFYMDEETAQTLKKLPLNMEYFYRCPWCTSLEQGAPLLHECKENSWNKYTIKYKENGSKVTGIMATSTLMYNNETVYEGAKITPETRLRKNRFQREGYEFIGWNTQKDGSGEFFEDEQEVFNLTAKNNEEIELYAQWKKSESTLHIHPGSGKLDGASGIVSVTGKYGTTMDVSASRLTPPAGAVVSFDTNGGTAVADMQTTRYFKEWSLSYPFNGELEGEVYHFTGPDGSEDTITAVYGHDTIVLPETQKDGLEFGGWYKDEACTQLVGPAGAEVIITQNTTLYAQWVSLQLTAVNDYSVYGGSGAVDLNWTNAENTLMTYQVYQQRENGAWTKLKQMLAEDSKVDETFYAKKETGTYTVPYSGLYTLTLTGAQGESYTHTSDEGEITLAGGKGGRVKATIFLHAGEVLTYNIGTSSGYNGGGTGDPYGNGGGMTSISSNKKGTLLIVGGGGGASSVREGGPGGAETSLTVTSNGGSGAVGGGGGYLGGNAGEALYHVHDDEACSYHEHDGDDTTGGDCYVSDICGGTTFDKSGGGLWYTYPHWNNDGSTICVQCGFNWVNGGKENGHSAYYPTKYTCKTCGASFEQGNQPASCTAGSGYALSCTIPEDYNCGKTDKTIESAKTAYGGSNYVNNTYCTLLSNESGVGTGNGKLYIRLESVEWIDGLELNDVVAKDMAAPEEIEEGQISKVLTGDARIKVSWQEPVDKGTSYRHQVAAHELITGREICRSNITANLLKSGIAGYYYCVNTRAHTTVTTDNSSFSRESTCAVKLCEYEQYLHVAVADRAGNLSDTVHIRIAEDDSLVPWPITTGPMTIQGDVGNIYPVAEREWYVRGDGETAFTLDFPAEMARGASASYQINYMDFQAEGGTTREEFSIYVPNDSLKQAEYEYHVSELTKQTTGVPWLEDGVYTQVLRSNWGKHLEVVQKFHIDAGFDGQRLWVYPSAGACWKGDVVHSDPEADRQNGLWLLVDGKAPELAGLDGLALWDGREEAFTIILSATDSGSGMREFYCMIQNREHYSQRRIDSADGQQLTLEMLPTDSILEGDVELHIYAVDNVGNCRHVAVDNPFFSMEASVQRLRSPQDGIFRAGDGGRLQVDTYGYAEGIEVEYPPQWQQWGCENVLEIDYTDGKAYHQQETIRFMVPLEAADGVYEFVVRARKSTGQSLEKRLQIQVEGSILDEIHTRLR